ncbi:MAG: hypothetical protein ACKO91_11500 [Acidimicrobiales bacterium]
MSRSRPCSWWCRRAARRDDGVSLAELVVASLVFIIVTALAAPLLVRVIRTQQSLGRIDGQVSSVNDATEQVLALGCGSTLAAAGSAAARTAIVERANTCGAIVGTLAGTAATVVPFGLVALSAGDLEATAGTTRLRVDSSWTHPTIGRTSWLPSGTSSSDTNAIRAGVPATGDLLLQRVVRVTTPVDGRQRVSTVSHLASRTESELPAGPLGRLEVLVPSGFDKVAVQFRTVGAGGPATETLWLVRTTLNLNDYTASATLMGGTALRVASFPYVPAGSYTVKGIRTDTGVESTLTTCTVNAGDPAARADINLCVIA